MHQLTYLEIYFEIVNGQCHSFRFDQLAINLVTKVDLLPLVTFKI